MGLILNGNEPNKILYNGAEVSLYFNGSKIWPDITPVLDEVTIGTQTWMSKNLAIDDGQGGISTRTVNYGQGDVVEYYYSWEAAVRVAASIPGWHLPTKAEWNTLANAVGGKSDAGTKLKSTYGWNKDGNGTDDYGFAAFPAGYPDLIIGNYANFWTTSELSSPDYAEYIKFRYNTTSMEFSNFRKSNEITVRLIKDS
ncbi:MAG: hypothetical protein IKE94_12995 [Aeriscardovia sp.]|nr:hypothetical protein [Aeriscardovia sp.]